MTSIIEALLVARYTGARDLAVLVATNPGRWLPAAVAAVATMPRPTRAAAIKMLDLVEIRLRVAFPDEEFLGWEAVS